MFAALVAACGSNNTKTPDAMIIVPDAPADAKVFMDAPPPMYDFSCLGNTGPATAPATITASGKTQELSMGGSQVIGGATVTAHKGNMLLGTATSDATTGDFMMTLATGGTPIDGYLESLKVMTMGGTLYRTTFLYPPAPLAADTSNIPVLMVSTSTWSTLEGIASATQDDTANGAFFLIVTDCGTSQINGATVSVKHGGNSVGTVFDVGQLSSMAAGIFIVFNVPDGSADVTVSYMSTTYPTKTLTAHKKNNTDIRNGSVTLTQVRPGV